MQEEKSDPATEAGEKLDPVQRLINLLLAEGFEPVHDEEQASFGERIYRRRERVLFKLGETVFDFITYPALTVKVLTRAIENIGNLFQARSGMDKALSVLQATTVYVCIVAKNETPLTARLEDLITTAGGAILIPVVFVPEINQVLYPNVEGRHGSVRPRVEYLQYLLGERREKVNLHEQTIRTFWISAGLLGVLLLGILASAIF
jgi:hypothetical protein